MVKKSLSSKLLRVSSIKQPSKQTFENQNLAIVLDFLYITDTYTFQIVH